MGRSERRARRALEKADLRTRLSKPATIGDIVQVMRAHNWRHHTPWYRKLWIRRGQHARAVVVIAKWLHRRLLDRR